jgi:hypothetical protein
VCGLRDREARAGHWCGRKPPRTAVVSRRAGLPTWLLGHSLEASAEEIVSFFLLVTC